MFTKDLARGCIICQRSFNLCFKVPEVLLFAAGVDQRTPLAPSSSNALKPTGAAGAFGMIPVVFSESNKAKIGAAIIERVAVDVVNLPIGRGIEQNACKFPSNTASARLCYSVRRATASTRPDVVFVHNGSVSQIQKDCSLSRNYLNVLIVPFDGRAAHLSAPPTVMRPVAKANALDLVALTSNRSEVSYPGKTTGKGCSYGKKEPGHAPNASARMSGHAITQANGVR